MYNYYIPKNGELYHHGILGQKWGVRRYQDSNGRLTDAGKKKLRAERLQKVKKGLKTAGELALTGAILYAYFNPEKTASLIIEGIKAVSNIMQQGAASVTAATAKKYTPQEVYDMAHQKLKEALAQARNAEKNGGMTIEQMQAVKNAKKEWQEARAAVEAAKAAAGL